MKKIVQRIIMVFFLLVIYVYVCNITFLPSSYILLQGENLNIPVLAGISVKDTNSQDILQTASNITNKQVEQVGKIDLSLSLFKLFTVKNITVNVIPKTTVVPVGKAIGMKLYTDGVLVVGMSEIEGKRPYENTGIQEGDRIIQINENDIRKYRRINERSEC